jgi:hypothetical protein
MAVAPEVQEGVSNLVNHCASVRAGENVLVLNEYGKADPEVAQLVTDAVKQTGAEYHVLWGEPIPRGSSDIPPVLLGAILACDKFISHYGLNRVVLDRSTRGKGIIQVNNWATTPAFMASPYARYHWGMVKAIFARIEEIFAGGERWRITSPEGTELSGRVGKATEVADAYFAQEAEASRFIRVFPGEVYSPVGSMDANGRIVVQYINNRDTQPWVEPAVLTIEHDRIVRIEGGEKARQLEEQIDERVKRYGDKAAMLDSWHGGMNPHSPLPGPATSDLGGAQCSPAMMHFHLGRGTDPISGGVLYPRVEADEVPLIDQGRLLLLDDPKLAEAAEAFGVQA